ncbi:MAG: hypothetical protein AB9842_01015 [Bacteroidales bacterium]
MKKLMTFIVLAALFSCKAPKKEAVVPQAPVDSLVQIYIAAWNAHDSLGVKQLFTQDALLIEDAIIAQGIDQVYAKWIQPYIMGVNNLRTTKLQEWSGTDRAGYTGIYEFQYYAQDSALKTTKGFYTLNWVKSDNKEWKITTDVIHATE